MQLTWAHPRYSAVPRGWCSQARPPDVRAPRLVRGSPGLFILNSSEAWGRTGKLQKVTSRYAAIPKSSQPELIARSPYLQGTGFLGSHEVSLGLSCTTAGLVEVVEPV